MVWNMYIVQETLHGLVLLKYEYNLYVCSQHMNRRIVLKNKQLQLWSDLSQLSSCFEMFLIIRQSVLCPIPSMRCVHELPWVRRPAHCHVQSKCPTSGVSGSARSLPGTQCSADYVTLLCTSFPKKANCITTVMESECHLKMNLAEDLESWTSFKNRTNKVAPLLIFYFTGSIAFHSVAIKHKTRSSVDAWVSHSLPFLHNIFILTCMYNTREQNNLWPNIGHHDLLAYFREIIICEK